MYASCKEKYWNTVFLLSLMNAATFVSFECQPNEVPNSKSGSLQQSQDPPESRPFFLCWSRICHILSIIFLHFHVLRNGLHYEVGEICLVLIYE